MRERARGRDPIRYLVPEPASKQTASTAPPWRRAAQAASAGARAERSTQALADRIARVASDRKALDIRVIDLRGIVGYTDFFVICSGNTERQTKAIHDAITS